MDEIKEENKNDEQQQQQEGQKQQASNKHANKLIYKKLREQMEFYFSDSNLSKDRFLKQEILKTPEGYIDLSVFLKFNKIRSLTDDLNVLKKSIKKSDILELDENKVNVRRKATFVELEQNDIDKRTVYVENLPSHVDHELLKRIFSRCGNVTYISLPKFKSTKQIKGFAFVEFDSKEGAKNAIETLNDPIVEQNNVEVGKFPKYNKQLISLEEKVSKVSQLLPVEEMEVVASANEDNNIQQEVTTVDVDPTEEKEEKKEKKSKNKKRKLAKINDSLEAGKEPNEKERKVDENDEKQIEKISNEETKEQNTENENKQEEEAPKKKKKNRRKKHSKMNAKKMKKELEVESTLLHLRVISKKEWLKLKKEYLNKQKENLSELKSKLKEISEKVGDGQKKHSYRRKNDESVEQMSTDAMETSTAPESSNEFSGCILKLTPKTLDDKVHSLFKLTRQQFKNEKLKEYEKDVAYVDLEKHTNKVYIRCKNRDIAKDLLNKSEFLNEFNRALISGKEENEYFEKIDKNKTKGQLKKEKKLRGKSQIVQKTYDIIDKSGLRDSNEQQEKDKNKYNNKNRPSSNIKPEILNKTNKPAETKGGHLKFDD